MLLRQFSATKLVRRALQTFALTAALSLPAGITKPLPVYSADEFFLDYGFIGRSIPTSSLEQFAHTGQVDKDLAPYLGDLSLANQQNLQTLLSTPLSNFSADLPEPLSDPFMLSQWLHSPIGETLLSAVGLFIQTRSRQNSPQAIRAAAVLAAADAEGLSLINLIRFYPTEGLRVDLQKILGFVKALETNIEQTEQLITETIQRSKVAAANDPPLDYSNLSVLADTPQFTGEVRSLMLNDPSRNHTYPADLYLPKNINELPGEMPTSIPVMVFSHGYGDTRSHPETIAAARSLAANGFLVAVPEHIGSNQAFQNNLVKGLTHESFDVMEFINRPQDISYLLDTLEQQNDTAFQGRLQLDRVGLMGHSFGGYTALALAGATVDLDLLEEQCNPVADFEPETINLSLLIQCRVLELSTSPQVIQQLTDGSLTDERVGFVFALSPMSNLFGEQGIRKIQIPVAIAGGTYDVATPIIQEQLLAFQSLTTTSKYFYLVEKLSHTPELTRTLLELIHPRSNIAENFEATEDGLFNSMVTVLIAHGKVHLLNDETYQPYLTSAYVESVRVNPSRVHLIQSFSTPSNPQE